MTPNAAAPITSFDLIKTVIDNSFITVAGLFTAFFMLIVSIFLYKGILKLDLKGLFVDNPSDIHISSTKFWSNIAYFVTTVAFLAINIAAPDTSSLEFIWLIYLGVVASAAVATKFLKLRYSSAGVLANQQNEDEQDRRDRRRSRRWNDPDRRGYGMDEHDYYDADDSHTSRQNASSMPYGYSERDESGE